MRSGQARDLEFVLTHVNDLSLAYAMKGLEVSVLPAVRPGPLKTSAAISSQAREVGTVC